MIAPRSLDFDRLSPADKGRVNEACEHFEQALQQGDKCGAEAYLGDTAEPLRSLLLRELLLLECEYRFQRFERPSAEELRRRFPGYEEMADERGVHMEVHTDDTLTARVDRNRMRQVLANLVDNALKYTPRGGGVAISAVRDRNNALLSVADTGVGIPPDELPRIWERLYRGDKSRSTRGLGLGLSLVKAIVNAHGGDVDVQSTPGAGSTFRIRLPLADGSEARTNMSPL